MKKKPNILFFFTDDQRFDTIAALGNSEIRTPNIDRLVESGTTFTHAHIPCGTSGAVCMPSRAMLHTGRTLFHIQEEGQEIPEEHITLGEALRGGGYQTFGTGKWHNGTRAYARSFTDGGEIFFGGMNDHWNVPAYSFQASGKYDNITNKVDNFLYTNDIQRQRCDHITVGKHSSELFCESAINFLNSYKSDDPFFMYISFMAPHDPRTMPEEFMRMYDPEKIILPPNYMVEHPFDYGIRDVRDEVLAAYPRNPDEIKRHIAEYYAMITHLDDELGKVLKALEATGKAEETIIVFAGDNGLALGQHGLMGKQNHYEHSIRVPLIFSGPGIPQNERRDTYAYLLDIYPTLCDLIGIDTPESVEGRSLRDAIISSENKVRETLYFAYTDKLRGVKNSRYKLIENIGGAANETQLFDLQEDLFETKNLYGLEEYDHVVSELREELFRFRDEWDDCEHRLGKAFWDRYYMLRGN